jgi:hypothetical protein
MTALQDDRAPPAAVGVSHLDLAIAYAQHGHRLVLLHECLGEGCSCGNRSKTCPAPNGKDSTGKHPRESSWLKNLIVDESAAMKAWGRYPTANVGLCPREDEIVLDIDPRHGGDETFNKLVTELGEPEGPCAITGGGGRHYWLKLPPNVDASVATRRINRALKKEGPGIDLRTCKNLVVVHPSVHKSGRRYEWIQGRSVLDCDTVVPSPAWQKALGLIDDSQPAREAPRIAEEESADLARAEWGLLDARLIDPDKGYEFWFRLGAALKTLGADGLRLWIEASRPSKDFDEDEIRKKWPGITGSTTASLFGMFDDADPGWRDRYRSTRPAASKRTRSTTSSTTPMDKGSGNDTPSSGPQWPQPMATAARHELAGEFLDLVEHETEADPHALLLQFLTFFGNCAGRSPHLMVGATRHGTNLFVTVTGASSRGRKGTSEAEVRRLMRLADEPWTNKNICSGLSSGEGLIDVVRDPREGPRDRKGKTTVIPGVSDKRCMVTEGEFARVLAQVAREGNVLSSVLRQAWDGDSLRTMVRGNPARATDPHISLVAHVTKFELLARMSETDLFNGLGNRFLWCCSRRTRKLPFGGNVDPHALGRLGQKLEGALAFARRTSRVGFTDAGTRYWAEAYDQISCDRPGLWGALTARAEAQVLRLALIYALLDSAPSIDVAHLEAARAVWTYCDASVAYLFGDRLGNPTADKLLSAIRAAGSAGITRTRLSAALGRNTPAAAMDTALQLLLDARLVRKGTVGEGPKATETWWLQ